MAIRVKWVRGPKWKPGWKMLQALRYFHIGSTLIAMLAVALVSALITMRIAIHGAVVEVPSLSGMTLEEAAAQTSKSRLNLTLENKFYSTTVPSGRVLSQSPAAGSKVRPEWHVRVTESMGAQRISIPDTVGMTERDAAMAVRRALLDLGTLAHLPAPGSSEMVLAQTPPPNAEGVDKPQVSLLLSSDETMAEKAYVMPNLVGLPWHEAQIRMSAVGLKLVAVTPYVAPVAAIPSVAAVGGEGAPGAPVLPVVVAPALPVVAPALAGGTVTSQVPAAGFRVTGSDTIKAYLNGARGAAAVGN